MFFALKREIMLFSLLLFILMNVVIKDGIADYLLFFPASPIYGKIIVENSAKLGGIIDSLSFLA
jgi:hypothetical protein